jgi:cytochrome c oxidase cbb3-type subunit 3
MSLRFPAELIFAACLALAAASCGRETRDYRSTAMQAPARAAAFEGNAWHISQGQRLYAWMNCSGCHAHGGGGMGPPLTDEEWRYGASMEEIVKTILDGRPGGMPAFRGRITDDQAWQLAAFVRTLSSQTRHDLRPSRADEPANIPPLDLSRPKPVRRVDPATDQRDVP